jgi:Uncharacterised conserved protein (DUF2228)
MMDSKDFAERGLKLVNDLKNPDPLKYRYYYDPPEFSTLAISLESPFIHYGVYRDSFGAGIYKNDVRKGCKFEFVAETLSEWFKDTQPSTANDENKPSGGLPQKRKANSQEDILKHFSRRSENEPNSKKRKLSKKTSSDPRSKKWLAQTPNGFGIIVPYDKEKELGYRPLAITKKKLEEVFDTFRKSAPDTAERKDAQKSLTELFNWTNIAVDEMDFGTGLELGVNLFCADQPGKPQMFTKSTLIFLKTAYRLLNTENLAEIAEKHIQLRKDIWDKYGASDSMPGCPIEISR